MKSSGLFFLVSILAFCSLVFASPDGGGSPKATDVAEKNMFTQGLFKLSANSDQFVYSTTTYTFTDLVVFSYFDDSQFFIYNQSGAKIDSVLLQNNQYHIFSTGEGVFSIEGTNSFTVLVGDPVSRYVLGFFAVDESGSPLSTRLNTYMPSYYTYGEHFIVFAYNDGTEYIVKNLQSGAVIAAGVLNNGEHLQLDGYSGTFLGVEANKPVSALSYTDQGYYIPATNGTFSGTQFFGFSGYVGSWPNGVIVVAYQDSTKYLVTNSTTGDTIASGFLNKGEVNATKVYSDLYWELTTDKPVTACNMPYAAYTTSYYYLVRQIDESGLGIGTNFYTPVINGQYDVFSFEDQNSITIYSLTQHDTIWSGVLNASENYSFSCSYGVYHVSSSKNISIITTWGGAWGADFVPLNFALGLPDLALSSNDITFDPDVEKRYPGDPIKIMAQVHNWGYQTAYDVTARFYDGDPDGGLAISPVMTIDSLPAGASHQFEFDWTVPSYPEYHAVHVFVDHRDDIVESNESNNQSFKFIIPNDDLLPPLSVVIESPVSVDVLGDTLAFNEFNVRAFLLNTGDVEAVNARATLELKEGLSLADTNLKTVTWPSIPAQQQVDNSWNVKIDYLIDGDAYFYSILVAADNASPKIVERMLLVKRPVGIKDDFIGQEIPGDFYLSQNYPNPFNPVTHVFYMLKKQAEIAIEVYDVRGRKIAILDRGIKPAGKYLAHFDAADFSSGVYFINLLVDNKKVAVRKAILLK